MREWRRESAIWLCTSARIDVLSVLSLRPSEGYARAAASSTPVSFWRNSSRLSDLPKKIQLSLLQMAVPWVLYIMDSHVFQFSLLECPVVCVETFGEHFVEEPWQGVDRIRVERSSGEMITDGHAVMHRYFGRHKRGGG